MQNYLHYMQTEGYSLHTCQTHSESIIVFTAWLQAQNSSIESLTYNQVLNYIQQLQQRGLKQITINSYINIIKHYINYLVKENSLPYNPILSIKIQGVQRHYFHQLLSSEELDELYNNYSTEERNYPDGKRIPPQHFNNLCRKRNKIILGLLIYQGITVHDLCNLRLQHICIKSGTIIIPQSLDSNARKLKLEAHQIYELHDYISNVRSQLPGHNTTDRLIINRSSAMGLSNITTNIGRVLKKQHSFYNNTLQIRASVISNWIKRYNLRQVQYMAGHKYISSTERYQQHNIDDLKQLINLHILNPED